jgi:hypothetical protein
MSSFVLEIKGAAAMSRTDINKIAENICIPLFAEVYGYTNLKNLFQLEKGGSVKETNASIDNQILNGLQPIS